MHKHKCPRCELVWEHPEPPRNGPVPEGYAEAHLCPGCGTNQRAKYWGDAPVTVLHSSRYGKGIVPVPDEGWGNFEELITGVGQMLAEFEEQLAVLDRAKKGKGNEKSKRGGQKARRVA